MSDKAAFFVKVFWEIEKNAYICALTASVGQRSGIIKSNKGIEKYDKINLKVARMEQRYFINGWLLPYSLRSHRIANSSPKNWLRHFSVLPTHYPYIFYFLTIQKAFYTFTSSKLILICYLADFFKK